MSWVSNIFNSAHTSQLGPSNDRKLEVISDVQATYRNDNNTTLREGRRKEYAQPMDEEEEAARAPYWHV